MFDIEKCKKILDDRIFEYLLAVPRKKQSKSKYKESITDKQLINARIVSSVRHQLKVNEIDASASSWAQYVDYSIDDLKNHLNKSLKNLDGYTWEDFINGDLHIDHILPKSMFNFDRINHPEFKRCWSLSNLQLLPARENIIKSNKCENFQTAF